MNYIKDFKGFINEQGGNSLDSDALILNGDSEVQSRLADEYKAEFGNTWNGFGGIEYTNNSKIKTVTNYFDGESSVSKRNEVQGVSPNEFSLNANFTYNLKPNEVKKVAFIYSKDGKEIFKSTEFTLKGLNKPTIGLVHLVTQITVPGKYKLTNTLDKNYWLEIEVK